MISYLTYWEQGGEASVLDEGKIHRGGGVYQNRSEVYDEYQTFTVNWKCRSFELESAKMSSYPGGVHTNNRVKMAFTIS